MSGVTHFERRDRTAFVHCTCHFCDKKIKATPRMLAGEKRKEWENQWLEHIKRHMAKDPMNWEMLDMALRTAMSVEYESERNR